MVQKEVEKEVKNSIRHLTEKKSVIYCVICNKEIIVSKCKLGKKKYCSIKCANIGRSDYYQNKEIREKLKKEQWNNPNVIKILREGASKLIMPYKDTSIELKIQDFLKDLGIEFYTHHYIKEIEHGYRCDIFIPTQDLMPLKTIIECDGNYWHDYPRGKELDHIHTKELLEKGFRVIRIWESEIKEMDLFSFVDKFWEVE